MILRNIDLFVALTLLALWVSLVSVASASGRQGGHAMRTSGAAECAAASATCEKPGR